MVRVLSLRQVGGVMEIRPLRRQSNTLLNKRKGGYCKVQIKSSATYDLAS